MAANVSTSFPIGRHGTRKTEISGRGKSKRGEARRKESRKDNLELRSREQVSSPRGKILEAAGGLDTGRTQEGTGLITRNGDGRPPNSVVRPACSARGNRKGAAPELVRIGEENEQRREQKFTFENAASPRRRSRPQVIENHRGAGVGGLESSGADAATAVPKARRVSVLDAVLSWSWSRSKPGSAAGSRFCCLLCVPPSCSFL